MLENITQSKPLLPRWINNILVIISTVVSTMLALLVLVLLYFDSREQNLA